MNPNTLNGFSPAAIEEAAGHLAADASLAPARFAVTTRWEGGTRHRCVAETATIGGVDHARGQEILVDEPVAIMGSDAGMNPQEVLLSALGTCMATVFVVAATRKGITIDSLETRCAGTLDLRGSFGIDPAIVPGFEAFACDLHVQSDATDAELQEVLQETVALSPNRYHLASPIRVDARVIRA